MNINRLPALTYNHLKMNYTAVNWNTVSAAPITITGDIEASDATGLNIPTGTGADELFENAYRCAVKCPDNTTSTIFIDFDKTVPNGSTVIELIGGANSNLTVYMNLNPICMQESLALRTLIKLEENAHLSLVQTYYSSCSHSFINDIGCVSYVNSSFDLCQLFPGRGNLYCGNRIDLIGDNSSFTGNVAYLTQNSARVDFNYIVNHIGKKTCSDYKTNGVLRDKSFKIFRGTIDFKTGASGSVGNELETVLLLSDDMVNQTIPLILCSEEDVEGNHGAAIGRLDEEMLFYMASRGIDEANAEKIITYGYFNRILGLIKNEDLRNKVSEYLEDVL